MRRFDLGAGWRKKQYNQKSHTGVIFPLFGGSPRWADSTLKLHGGWPPRRNHVIKLKSSWVTILQGVEFSIFPLILAWALQQCSATALPVIKLLRFFVPISSDTGTWLTNIIAISITRVSMLTRVKNAILTQDFCSLVCPIIWTWHAVTQRMERMYLVEFWQYFYEASTCRILPSNREPKLHGKFEFAHAVTLSGSLFKF